MPISPSRRRIWALADAHIGHVSDERDGADWLDMMMRDRRDHMGPADYTLYLGDMSHSHTEEQLARFVQVRDASGVAPWFQIAGNHDFALVRTGLFQRIINQPRYWRVTDGNLLILSLPAERGNAAGLFLPPVEAWLRQQIASNPDKNVIIAAHQFPYDTVQNSTRPARCLYPRAAVERFLTEVHVDLWLGGHVHSGPRTPQASACRNGTAFINVASASHTYGRSECNSVMLELTAGSRDGRALVRDHDRARYLDDHATPLRFAHPCEFSPDGPTQTPFDLNVPDHYSRIEEEQVEGF